MLDSIDRQLIKMVDAAMALDRWALERLFNLVDRGQAFLSARLTYQRNKR